MNEKFQYRTRRAIKNFEFIVSERAQVCHDNSSAEYVNLTTCFHFVVILKKIALTFE